MKRRTKIVIGLVAFAVVFVFFVPIVPEDILPPEEPEAGIKLPVQTPQQENPLGHKGRNPAEIGA